MFTDFLRGIHRTFLAVFWGKNIFWHVALASITAALVVSGLDWTFYTYTRSEKLYALIMTAGIGGFFIPIIVPLALYFLGRARGSQYLKITGIASAQAVIIAWLVSSTYKAFTGRIQPEFLTTFSMEDITRNFNFGFWENGIFWGWPSSHTSVAFAMGVVIFLLIRYPAIRIMALAWAFIVGIGAAVGFHWLSDAIAGMMLGTLVGYVVASRAKSSLK